jgi:hypothetical protein
LTPLEFLLGAVLVILGYGFLAGAIKFADRLPLVAAIAYAMQKASEPWKDIAAGIGVFIGLMGMFILFGMIGSTLLAKGVLLFLP